jgi:hypothetical protein
VKRIANFLQLTLCFLFLVVANSARSGGTASQSATPAGCLCEIKQALDPACFSGAASCDNLPSKVSKIFLTLSIALGNERLERKNPAFSNESAGCEVAPQGITARKALFVQR